MPKIKALTDKEIRSQMKQGVEQIKDNVVPGLFLQKLKSDYSWRLRYSVNGKRSYYVIGNYTSISATEARKQALEAKQLAKQGIDPNEYKRKQKEELLRQQNRKKVIDLIDEYLEIKKHNVSEARFKKNYVGTFKNYVIPFIGKKFIDEISKDEIRELVKKVPKIKLKKETRSGNKTYKAKEVLNIIKDMFEFAVDNGYLENNPAYSIKLDKILPKHKVKHMPAIVNEKEVKELYKKILEINNPVTSKILQFQALTGLRSGNIENLKWEYIDWENKLIVFPEIAMKKKENEFKLPLTDTLIKILEFFKPLSGEKEYVFISAKNNRPISENFLSDQYKKLGYKGKHTPHGWRSTFRTIATEKYYEHNIPLEIIKSQFHHKIGDKVTQAYLRTNFLDKRRELLKWWEEFLTSVV